MMKLKISSQKKVGPEKHPEGGFTLIELIMIVLLIGLLAVAAIPKFADLQDQAKRGAEKATVGAVRSGISLYQNKSILTKRSPLFPSQLDAGTDSPASDANPFFTDVLSSAVTSDWVKSGLAYSAASGTIYTYDPATGIFSGNAGLVSLWNLDAIDSGGLIGSGSLVGQLFGNAQLQQGKVGDALNFGTGSDGLNGYVQVPDSPELNLTTAGTVGAWIYADSLIPNASAGIIHKGDMPDFSDEAYSLQFWTGNTIALILDSQPGSIAIVQSTIDITPNQWHYVTGTWSPSGMNIYVDGVLSNSNTTAVVAQTSSGALNIGAQLSTRYSSDLQNLGFQGSIDQAQIYDRALTADEIAAYYNATK